MELSYRHQFIFIHVYRAGGQSVSEALRPHADVPMPALSRIPLLRRSFDGRLYEVRAHNYGHIKAKELQARFPQHELDGFFKFAFVRNPWDWHVSVYHYVRQRPKHPNYAFFKAFRDFDEYLDWRVHTMGAELQSEFVCDASGNLLVDFVGHYETLDEDFAAVSRRLGIETTLPHKDGSSHLDFRDYYSTASRELVAEAYREDIERFGYAFDGRAPGPSLSGGRDGS
jgi:hypothetical protein